MVSAAGLIALALVAWGCGGDSEDAGGPRTAPATGVPVAGGKCKPEPEAAAARRKRVSEGKLTGREAKIDELTEVHQCEIERNTIKFAKRFCEIEVGKARLEGRMSEEQANRYAALQEKAGC